MHNIYTNFRCYIEDPRNLTKIENREYFKPSAKLLALKLYEHHSVYRLTQYVWSLSGIYRRLVILYLLRKFQCSR